MAELPFPVFMKMFLDLVQEERDNYLKLPFSEKHIVRIWVSAVLTVNGATLLSKEPGLDQHWT